MSRSSAFCSEVALDGKAKEKKGYEHRKGKQPGSNCITEAPLTAFELAYVLRVGVSVRACVLISLSLSLCLFVCKSLRVCLCRIKTYRTIRTGDDLFEARIIFATVDRFLVRNDHFRFFVVPKQRNKGQGYS